MSEPERTCIGCGAKAPRRLLVRLGVEDERVIVDVEKTAGGRGAWLHPGPECLRKAVRRRALLRALRRTDLAWDAAQLETELTGSPRKD